MLGIFPLVFQRVRNLFVCHWEALCFSCWARRRCDRYYDFGHVSLYSGSWVDGDGVSVLSPHFMLLELALFHLSSSPGSTGPSCDLSQRSLPPAGVRDAMRSHRGRARVRITQKQIDLWKSGQCFFFSPKRGGDLSFASFLESCIISYILWICIMLPLLNFLETNSHK